jgi:toxin ParE1/3/4
MIAVMKWSLKEFGEATALRYDALMTQALTDIGDDPERPGVQPRSDLAEGVLVYHLRFSRGRVKSAPGVVRNPRHFVIYRRRRDQTTVIEILRVLHDSRDLPRYPVRNTRRHGDVELVESDETAGRRASFRTRPWGSAER